MTPAAVLAGLGVAVGMAGTLLPFLPGLWLILLAMIAYGLTTGFGTVGVISMSVATLALAIGTYLGIRIPQRAASEEGLTLRDQIAGLTIAVIGFFAVPVIGMALGFVAGIFATRWIRSRDAGSAWQSARRAMGSVVRASLAQFSAAVAMAGTFALWVWFG